MIPFAAVSCLIRMAPGAGEEMEVSLRDLSALGFSFRLPEGEGAGFPKGMAALEFCFRPTGQEGRCVLAPGDVRWTVRRGKGFRLFRGETDHPGFHALALDLMKKMNAYTRAWEESGEAAAALQAGGEDPGEDFPADGADFLALRCRGKAAPADWGRGMALWLPLERPGAAERFLAEGFRGLWRERLAEAGLETHPLAGLAVRGIQAGSAWCPDLVPSGAVLARLRDRAAREGLDFGVVLPPVPESLAADLPERVRGLGCEITVNDFGTAALLAGEPLTMGVLLNRRRKDPRLAARTLPPGMDLNGANSAPVRAMLKKTGFSRLEWETCGYEFTPPEMPGTLRLPFYQISTSSRCPLRAVLEEGDRGRQMPAGGCGKRPCADTVFLYGKGLPVIGRYTTLFGYDGEALWRADPLARLRARGVDRILACL